MEYSYVFINKEDLTLQIRDACVETVADDDLITSTEAIPRVVLKFLGAKPVSLGAAVVYSKAEIQIELANNVWGSSSLETIGKEGI